MNRLREFSRSWSSQDEDSRNAALLIAGISLVVIIALAIVGYGYFQDRGKNKDDILVVGGREFSYDYLISRLNPYMPGTGTYSVDQFTNILSGVISQVEHEELMRYTAKAHDISVSDEELDKQIRKDLNLTDESSKEALATALRKELLDTGLSLGEYREMQRAQVIQNKVRAAAADALPAQTEQVDLGLIKAKSQDDANAAKARLDNGEQFNIVAASASIDPSSSKAGSAGWVARGSYDTKLEDAMFSQEVGTISGVIQTDDGFYILQVRARETRDTTVDIRDAVGRHAFDTALNEGRNAIGSKIVLTTAQVSRLANHFSTSLNPGG